MISPTQMTASQKTIRMSVNRGVVPPSLTIYAFLLSIFIAQIEYSLFLCISYQPPVTTSVTSRAVANLSSVTKRFLIILT